MIQKNLTVLLMAGLLAAAGGSAAQDRPDTLSSADSGSSLSAASSPLPLSAPLTPLPSGALTNVNAVKTNWSELRKRLLMADTSMTQRWMLLSPSTFGDYDAWDEQYMRHWERTPDLMLRRQINRKFLSPDGRLIGKP
jgi:hypothetical protein